LLGLSKTHGSNETPSRILVDPVSYLIVYLLKTAASPELALDMFSSVFFPSSLTGTER